MSRAPTPKTDIVGLPAPSDEDRAALVEALSEILERNFRRRQAPREKPEERPAR